jgi:hypothetical protein
MWIRLAAACHHPRVPPAVSVVMAVHNGERFLEEAVQSVLEQTLTDLELVAIDDGSTDSTPALLAAFASRDARVVVHRHANRGRPLSLNRGVELARADLVARLDADDVCLPERLARQLAFLREHEQVAVVGGAVRVIDAAGRCFEESRYPLSDAEIRAAFAYTSPFVHSAVTFRRSAFEQAGGYRPCNDAEDVDLWLRLAERHALANLPEPVVAYRFHADQVSVRRCELQALGVVAARFAARERAAGRPDPLDGIEAVDERWLRSRGVAPSEIATTVVKSQAWLANVIARAGGAEQAEALLAAAQARASSEGGSAGLRAVVHRARATRCYEQGRPLRARLERGRAALAERRR